MALGRLLAFFNIPCIKCDALERSMVKVGALVFCYKCIEKEFKTDDPVRLEKEVYQKWLDKWRKQAGL